MKHPAMIALGSAMLLNQVGLRAEPGSLGSSAIKPEVATSLATFGLTVVVGAADLVSNSVKSTVAPADAAILGREVTELADRYREKVREATFASSLVRSNGETIITATQVLATSAGVGAAPAAAIAAVARYGNSRFAESIAQEGKVRAVGLLSAGLQSMRKEDKKIFDALLTRNDLEGAVNLFDARTNRLSTLETQFRNDPEAGAVARTYLIQTLKETTSAAVIQAGKANAKATNVEIQFANYIKITKEFEKLVKEKFDVLEKNSEKLNSEIKSVANDLDSLQKDQAATAYQVGLFQDMLFDQQPPNIKLAMLQAGAKPGLSDDQRSKLQKYFEVEVRKQEILAAANDVVNVASNVNAIMMNLGIKDQRVSDAVRYGTAANNALAQAFSGNYLGSIATVSGFFGGAQEDPVQQQFYAAFAELKAIQQKLDEIIELQKQTLLAIEHFSRQLADVEKRMQERLDNIEFELKVISEASKLIIWAPYQPCFDIWGHRGRPEYNFNETNLRFQSAKGVTALLANEWGHTFECSSKLRGLYSQLRYSANFDNPIRLDFAELKILEGPNDEGRIYKRGDLDSFLRGVYQPAVNLLEASWTERQQKKPGWGSFAGAFALLATPSASTKELRERMSKIDAIPTANPLSACSANSLLSLRAKTLLCTNVSKFDAKEHSALANEQMAVQRSLRFLREPIIREQVGDLVKLSGFVANAADFAPGGSDKQPPYTVEQLTKITYSYGREILDGALMMSDIAVAQQALIYGDLTAYFVFEKLWDAQQKRFRKPQTQSEKWAWNLLGNQDDPWLGRNVLMLILESSLRPCKRGPCKAEDIMYTIAISNFYPMPADAKRQGQMPPLAPIERQSGKEWLLAIFDLPSEVTFEELDTKNGQLIPRRVVLKLDGLVLQLPTPADWNARRLDYPPGLVDRIREREILAQRWADYAVLDAEKDGRRSTQLIQILARGTQ